MDPFLVRAKFTIPQSQPRDLCVKEHDLIRIIQKTDDGKLWLGESNGRQGWIDPSVVDTVDNAFARVVQVYPVKKASDVHLAVGSIAHVINPYHRDWWEIEFENHKRVFPGNHLEIIPCKSLNAVALFDFKKTATGDLDFKKDERIVSIEQTHDKNWCMGTIGDRRGLFPYNYASFFVVEGEKTNKIAIVRYPYSPVEAGELTLTVGQEVEILEEFPDGWLKGRSGKSFGLLPSTFVEIVEKSPVATAVAVKKDREPLKNEASKNNHAANIAKNVECAICLDYADNAVETSCCHNVFCEECLKSMPKQICPKCRSTCFQALPSIVVRRIVGELEVECPNDACDLKTARSELQAHIAKCEHKVYECRCSFKGVKGKLAAHLIEAHLNDVIQMCKPLYK